MSHRLCEITHNKNCINLNFSAIISTQITYAKQRYLKRISYWYVCICRWRMYVKFMLCIVQERCGAVNFSSKKKPNFSGIECLFVQWITMSTKRSPRTSGSGSSSTTTMDDNYVDDLLDEDRFSKKKDELEQFQERMKEAKCKWNQLHNNLPKPKR